MAEEVKRLRYFNGEFLREADFITEQQYHMGMRRLHNKELHTWGISRGLALSYLTGASRADISEGVAFDEMGHEILLIGNTQTNDLSGFKGKTVYITIAHDETGTDPTSEGGVTGVTDTRWTERPLIEVSEAPPGSPGLKLILGRVTVDGSGEITARDEGADPNRRRFAGVVGGDLDVRSLSLTDPVRASSEWAKMSLGAANRADLQGSLKVSGSAEIGGNLTIAGSVSGTNLFGTDQIRNNAVTAGKLQSDAAVDANRAVTASHIRDGAVTASKLAALSVGPAALQDGAVTAAKIADGSVSTADLANNAITAAKLQSDAAVDANRAVTTNHLRDGAVTAAKLGGLSVGIGAIQDGAVTAAKIANGSVGTAELANLAVTEPKLASGAVSTRTIPDNAVTAAKIADDSISMAKLHKRMAWDSATTIAANGTQGFNVLAVPLSSPRGTTLLVEAYTTTPGGRFEWHEESLTGTGATPWINQGVYFHNLTAAAIEIRFKLYELLPA
jgi:hypothetical protein